MLEQKNSSFTDHLSIFNTLENPVVLFSEQDEAVFYNKLFIEYFPNVNKENDFLSQLIFYEQKITPITLNLFKIIETFKASKLLTTSIEQVWVKIPQSNDFIAVSLKLNKLSLENKTSILLIIQNRKLNNLNNAQFNLIEQHFSGHFITNGKGFITHPNAAFCKLTSLTRDELKDLTYIDWLKRQASFDNSFNEIMSTILLSHSWSGFVKIKNEKGKTFKSILNLSMLVDSKNNVEHFVGILQDITDIKNAEAEISQISNFDTLTGLPNRKNLSLNIKQYIDPTYNEHYCIFMLGIDDFDAFIQNYGSEEGDQLLIQVANKIQRYTDNAVIISKMEGGNFAVLFNTGQKDNPTLAIEDSRKKALDLLSELDGFYQLSEHTLNSTFSAGICLFPFEGLESEKLPAEQIINFASMSLQKAKRKGNQLHIFDKNLQDKTNKYLKLVEALSTSELDEEFQVYFQGQADKSGKIVAAETLIRWIHPKLGMIPPSKFIPIAEKGKQIIKIGLWVMHKSFIQTYAWNKMNPDFRVSVNISPVQFHEKNFVEIIIGLLKFTQVNPKNITLELTEGVLIKHSQLALLKIQHLVSLGVEVSIDDFGTGYSSLSYLQKLPIHELKIDQSFIAHLRENPDDDAIVDSIIQLAQNKHLKVVA